MEQNIAIKAMELNESIHEKNGIQIKGGKTYTKVVHRIEAFRRTVGYDYGIETNIQILNGGYVCNAVIKHKDGYVVGSGSSYSGVLAKEKALEKMETTAIGRALASLGLGGDEYASIEEIDSHESRYAKPVPFTDEEANLLTGRIRKAKYTAELNEEKALARAAWPRMSKEQQKLITDEIEKRSAYLSQAPLPQAAE